MRECSEFTGLASEGSRRRGGATRGFPASPHERAALSRERGSAKRSRSASEGDYQKDQRDETTSGHAHNRIWISIRATISARQKHYEGAEWSPSIGQANDAGILSITARVVRFPASAGDYQTNEPGGETTKWPQGASKAEWMVTVGERPSEAAVLGSRSCCS